MKMVSPTGRCAEISAAEISKIANAVRDYPRRCVIEYARFTNLPAGLINLALASVPQLTAQAERGAIAVCYHGRRPEWFHYLRNKHLVSRRVPSFRLPQAKLSEAAQSDQRRAQQTYAASGGLPPETFRRWNILSRQMRAIQGEFASLQRAINRL